MSELLGKIEDSIIKAPPEALPLLLGDLERLKGQVFFRMLTCAFSPSQTQATEEQLLTIPQVANRLSIPESRAYELARQKKLHSVRIGKYVRVPLNSLAEYERSLSSSSK